MTAKKKKDGGQRNPIMPLPILNDAYRLKASLL